MPSWTDAVDDGTLRGIELQLDARVGVLARSSPLGARWQSSDSRAL